MRKQSPCMSSDMGAKDVVEGGDVVNLVGVLGFRNSGPEDGDGLSEVHRLGEKEVPGEEPEAPKTRQVPVTWRDRRRTEALKRAPWLL